MWSHNSSKNVPWSNGEVKTFLSLLADERIQSELDEAVRNEKIFQELSEAMTIQGFNRSSRQCREKLKKLKSDYRAIRDNSGRSGTERRHWKWFHDMDAIYGEKPTSNDRESGVDKAVQTQSPASCGTSENEVNAPDLSGAQELPGTEGTPALAGPSRSQSPAALSSASMPQPRTAKRKRNTVTSLLSTALERMADLDEKLLERTTEINSLLAEEMRLSREEMRLSREQMQKETEQRRVELSQQDRFNNAFLEVLRGLVSVVADKSK